MALKIFSNLCEKITKDPRYETIKIFDKGDMEDCVSLNWEMDELVQFFIHIHKNLIYKFQVN